MERKMNASSASYDSSRSYRNKSADGERSSDEENDDEEDNLYEEASDSCDSEAVAGEVVHSGSPPKGCSSSPKVSPILSHRKGVPLGDGAKIPSPTEPQTRRVKHAPASEVPSLSKSDLNFSNYQRNPLHSTPQEGPRTRSQVVSHPKVQISTATGNLSNVSRESPPASAAVKKIPPRSSAKTKTLATAPIVRSESSKPDNLTVIVLCIVLIMMGVYALCRVSNDPQPENRDDSPLQPNQILEDFLQAFDQLNSSFPTQTTTFWKVLRSGTRSIIMQEYPVAPAVFIVAVPKDAQQTALCIIRKYAAVVTTAFQGRPPIEFTHHLRSADTPEHIKHVIDDTLNHGFSKGSRVAIIHELDKLHGKSAMMFHGYCDNENAPFTRVVVLFTLHMDAGSGEMDDFVERKLSQVWGRYLDNDKLFPLLSRIGNRNAFVRQESNEILEAHSCL